MKSMLDHATKKLLWQTLTLAIQQSNAGRYLKDCAVEDIVNAQINKLEDMESGLEVTAE